METKTKLGMKHDEFNQTDDNNTLAHMKTNDKDGPP